MKKLTLCLGFVAFAAFSVTVGCDSNGNVGGGPDMTMTGGNPDMTMTDGSPDMSFVCVMNPMSDPDFLNGCAPATVQSVDITPFYPTLAPGGVLPPL